jgi:hypothetical protein
MRERFLPRLTAAEPGALLDEAGDNLDPHKIWDHDEQREARRPRRALGRRRHHRHGGVGRGREDRRQAAVPLLADRYGDGKPNRKVFVYAAGGYYYPGKGLTRAAGRDARLPRPRLPRREDEDRRRAARRGPRRIEAVLEVLCGDGSAAGGRRQRPLRPRHRIAYAKAISPYDLFWYEEAGDPLDYELQATLPSTTAARWPPARTCSRCRTPAT